MRRLVLVSAATFSPTLAYAHVGNGVPHGFHAGFLHPILGIDHVLVMLSVGLVARYTGGRAVWLLPAVFLSSMAVGAAFGMCGYTASSAELVVAASILFMGAIVMVNRRLSSSVLVPLLAFFAFFHGQTHGHEMPANVSGFTYALGFLGATSLLQLAGVALGLGIRSKGPGAERAIGGGMMLAGVGFLSGLF